MVPLTGEVALGPVFMVGACQSPNFFHDQVSSFSYQTALALTSQAPGDLLLHSMLYDLTLLERNSEVSNPTDQIHPSVSLPFLSCPYFVM